MKPARAWAEELARESLRDGVEILRAQDGLPTLRVDGVMFHSRYKPREEAMRLVDEANLPQGVPVLVIGLGCAYHVTELLARGHAVLVLEPDHSVAKCALAETPQGLNFQLAIGEASTVCDAPEVRVAVQQGARVLVHPPTERVHPEWVAHCLIEIDRVKLAGRKPAVSVVGPMYGGSLPIAGYLATAFENLGHRTLFIDTSEAWSLYQTVTASVKSKNASSQLGNMLAHTLEQWCYARVAEFAPNICIVLAQAPVSPAFPRRLRKENIVSGFWFVENWRHMPYWKQICREYDYFFHIQPGEFETHLAEAGCPAHAFVQTACDPFVHRPVSLSPDEHTEFDCDVAFAGAGYYNRNQFLLGLTDYKLKIWGTEWSARELQPHLCRPDQRFTPDDFARITAGAKINLNLHSSATHAGVDPRCDAVNPRVFEIAACGGFQICDPCQGLEAFFDFKSELPVYRNIKECRALIDYYLKADKERIEIAGAARARALRDHTYAHRATQMLELFLSTYPGPILEKGIRMERTVAEIVEKIGTDSPLGKYLSSLPADTPFSQAALGERIPPMGTPLSDPEGIFAYLRELRTSADQLMAIYDGA